MEYDVGVTQVFRDISSTDLAVVIDEHKSVPWNNNFECTSYKKTPLDFYLSDVF